MDDCRSKNKDKEVDDDDEDKDRDGDGLLSVESTRAHIKLSPQKHMRPEWLHGHLLNT
jgi:hypothetical protein